MTLSLFPGLEKRVMVTFEDIIKIYKILEEKDLEHQTNYMPLKDLQ
jgi:hypothetical protein